MLDNACTELAHILHLPLVGINCFNSKARLGESIEKGREKSPSSSENRIVITVLVTGAIELLIKTVPEFERKGGNTGPIENTLPFKKRASESTSNQSHIPKQGYNQ